MITDLLQHHKLEKKLLRVVGDYIQCVLSLLVVCVLFLSTEGLIQRITTEIERSSIERCKTRTKIISLANRNRCKQHNEPIRIRSKYM